MAISNPKFVGALLHSVTKQGSLPIVDLPAIQVIKSKEQKLRAVETNVSRRNALLYLSTGTLFGFTLLSTEPAEARVGRLENKKKVMEKLEKLREEAGVSKPKIEGNAQKRLPPTLLPALSFPDSKELSSGPVIETMLP